MIGFLVLIGLFYRKLLISKSDFLNVNSAKNKSAKEEDEYISSASKISEAISQHNEEVKTTKPSPNEDNPRPTIFPTQNSSNDDVNASTKDPNVMVSDVNENNASAHSVSQSTLDLFSHQESITHEDASKESNLHTASSTNEESRSHTESNTKESSLHSESSTSEESNSNTASSSHTASSTHEESSSHTTSSTHEESNTDKESSTHEESSSHTESNTDKESSAHEESSSHTESNNI